MGENRDSGTVPVEKGRFTFPKSEKLCLRDEIEAVFASRTSFVNYPVRTLYALTDRGDDAPRLKLLISVPKKRLRHAVDRNRVKRLYREAFRLRKSDFVDLVPEGKTLLLAMVFVSDNVCTFTEAQASVDKAYFKLSAALGAKCNPTVPLSDVGSQDSLP